MVISITRIQSPIYFVLYHILVCYCVYQIFELCLMLKGPITYVYVKILPPILVTRQQHILSFLCVYF
jgi:hypothetical protein